MCADWSLVAEASLQREGRSFIHVMFEKERKAIRRPGQAKISVLHVRPHHGPATACRSSKNCRDAYTSASSCAAEIAAAVGRYRSDICLFEV